MLTHGLFRAFISTLTLVTAAAWSLYNHIEVSCIVVVWLSGDSRYRLTLQSLCLFDDPLGKRGGHDGRWWGVGGVGCRCSRSSVAAGSLDGEVAEAGLWSELVRPAL